LEVEMVAAPVDSLDPEAVMAVDSEADSAEDA